MITNMKLFTSDIIEVKYITNKVNNFFVSFDNIDVKKRYVNNISLLLSEDSVFVKSGNVLGKHIIFYGDSDLVNVKRGASSFSLSIKDGGVANENYKDIVKVDTVYSQNVSFG